MRASSSRPPAPGLAPSLSSEGAHESFDAIAALHLRPVRELMMEMHLGAPPRSWIALCVPAAQTVRRFAEQINRDALVPRLDALIAALESASEGGGARIEGAAREEIQRRYAALVASLPSFSSVDAECDRRERSIARALLEQVPGVHALVLERLASAGLTGLSALLRASADELAAATAIPTDTAARIVAQLARYRSDSASIAGSADLPIELERLKQLCDELRRVHAAHERAAEAWSADALADKRRHRTDRARVLLQIEVVLARLGELERIDALGRLCFERKISDLEAYLQQAAQSSARN